ncbi:IS3-like element ISGau1 family transposase [Gemmatimonas aurantiaca]|uniref:IS3-like element ISGau1 family transposase n=1 Tax=Gemmatimonas aurantiaca TaxID=173480 RepID=UPI0012EA4EF5|nr:IS3-like element ISGau1 family transposase [Gemmatimonas aurantiaca]
MERSRRQFSPELKQRIVEELEAGHLSVREAARTVQTSAAMVHHWLEEFGRYRPKRDVVEVVMKSEQERIAALEKALAEAHLTLQVYDELITQANRVYKTDPKKKLWYNTARACCDERALPVRAVCARLGRTRDAYYKRAARVGGGERGASKAVVLAQVAVVRAAQPRVGTRKLHTHLAAAGVAVGRDRLFTWLRAAAALVPRKRRRTFTTYSKHGYVVAPNRLKDAEITGPRQAVVSDSTYLRLAPDRFAYLFLVTDVYARRIVGWHLSQDLSHHSALQALHHAIQTIGAADGVLHHSDRGSQYCCHAYRRALAAARLLPSMTDANHCYQNAIAERVNGILKDEFDLDAIFPSLPAAQRAVADAIHRYNTVRLHGSLQLQTPAHVFTHAA